MRVLAGERRRFGYRRLHVLLRQEGLVVNRKKTERLDREERLTVRRRRGRKKATGTRAPILVEARPNARWSVDFVHDQLVSGRRLRILNDEPSCAIGSSTMASDDVTKECLAAVVDTSISGRRVARELKAIVARRGKPGLIVSDHGTEFTSNAMLAWTQSAQIAWPAPSSLGPMVRLGAASRRASRSRTGFAKRSTPGCATSCSTRRCSSASTRPASTSPGGSPTTTIADRTLRSATKRRRPMPPGSPQRAAGCKERKRSASRPLLRRRESARVKRRLQFQLHDHRGSEHNL